MYLHTFQIQTVRLNSSRTLYDTGTPVHQRRYYHGSPYHSRTSLFVYFPRCVVVLRISGRAVCHPYRTLHCTVPYVYLVSVALILNSNVHQPCRTAKRPGTVDLRVEAPHLYHKYIYLEGEGPNPKKESLACCFLLPRHRSTERNQHEKCRGRINTSM